MSAPKRHPTGMVSVTSTAQTQGRIEIFGYGQDDRAINPGDLVIVSSEVLQENAHKQRVEYVLRLRGRDMHLFEEAAHTANLLWNDNKDWLNAPMGQAVDMRGKTEIRRDEQLKLIGKFIEKNL